MFWQKRHLYYQITKGKITATYIEEDRSITEYCNALNHPRTPMGNFHEIEACFKSLSRRLTPEKLFSKNHTAIVHLLDAVEGGYTNVEIRAFLEAALGSGAREAFLPSSSIMLTRNQILEGTFNEHDKS